jgi:hypothetical protein
MSKGKEWTQLMSECGAVSKTVSKNSDAVPTIAARVLRCS